GTLTEAGRESPYRNRPVGENLHLFERMRAGEFEDGTHVLRAKIDMASPNVNMRDPVLFRIMHVTHYRAGTQWVIYPMYDYAHPIEAARIYTGSNSKFLRRNRCCEAGRRGGCRSTRTCHS